MSRTVPLDRRTLDGQGDRREPVRTITAVRTPSNKPIRQLLNLFLLQFVYYFVATWNLRVVAQAHFVSIAISDAGLAAVNFTLIQRISKAESNLARLCYVVGGVAGSLLATFLTKLVYGA